MLANKLFLSLLAIFAPLPLTSAQNGNFSIYAYGNGLNGFPLIYSEGNALLGDISAISGSNLSDVFFSIQNGGLLAYPNATSTQAAKHGVNYTWNSLQLTVPVDSGSGNTVIFAQDVTSRSAAGEWRLYGPYVFLYNGSKQLVSYFFAEPTNVAGVFSLLWNLSEKQQAQNPNAVPVALRTVAPEDESDGGSMA